MAKHGQTIRVCGLPLDINENRLSDKLYIHFLRKKNGGGDIINVTVPETTPGSALITFEDSEVAQRVITHGNHTLSVNDKQYAMTVSLHQKEMEADELFIDIKVTVDYNKLPGGKAALSDIRRKFPDIQFNFDTQDNLCILRGRYSEVQTLTKSLLSGTNPDNTQNVQLPKSEVTSDQKGFHSNKGRGEIQRETEVKVQTLTKSLLSGTNSDNTQNVQFPKSEVTSDQKGFHSNKGRGEIQRETEFKVQTLTKSLLSGTNSDNAQNVQFPKSEVTTSDQKGYHSNKGRGEIQRETEVSGQACGLDLPECSVTTSERSRTPPHASYTNYSEISGAVEEGPSVEDLSMVIDTDIFRYLQHCSLDYKGILDRHGVEVLDVTTKDITTLFIQAGAVGGGMESMKRAYEELGWLYQEKEAQLRKVHLPKGSLHVQELQQAIEVLTQTFPKLLINEDKANVYLVGSGSSVSEAKQFLMDMEPTTDVYGRDKNKPSNVLFQPSGASSLSFMADTQPRRGGAEGIKTYKLSATFGSDASPDEDNDCSFSLLGEVKTPEETYPPWSTLPNGQCFDSGPTSDIMSLKVQPPLSSSRPKDLKVLTKTAEDTLSKKNEPLGSSRPKDLKAVTKTADDTLSKKNEPLSTAPMKRPPSPSFGLNNTNRTKNAANFSVSRSYSLDYTPISIDKAAPTDSVRHSNSGSLPRHTNSFSGQGRSKLDARASNSAVDTFSSLKHDSSSESMESFSVEVMVVEAQWVYMKEKYCTQIENLTTDLQMKETRIGNGADKYVILHLKGADATNVGNTQQALKELSAEVAKDFSTEVLQLVDLGVPDSKKEILEYSCDFVREKFEKVHISPQLKSIVFFGPNVDCRNAMHAMKELLHTGTKREISTEERPIDLQVPSSAPPPNSGSLYPTLNNLAWFDDKSTMDTSAPNNSLPKDSVQRMSSDYPQGTKAKQRDREPEAEYREERLKKDNLNLAQKKRDAQPSFKGEGPSDAQTAPVPKPRLAPAEYLDRKSFRTRTQGDTSSGVKEKKCKGSTPLSDVSSQLLLTGSKSDTSQTLSSTGLWRQTDDVDPQSTINQMKVSSEQDEALRKGNTARSFEIGTSEESASKILGQCPWCQGKVNPYCSECPKSDRPVNRDGHQPVEHGLFCGCGNRVESVTPCRVALCPKCKEKVHSNCRVCPKSAEPVSGIRGTMGCTEMSFSLAGHIKDTTLKLTYDIPDGIQGIDHPNPGAPFQGGKFHAFLPMNDITRKLLPSLEQAFKKGLTFNVKSMNTGDVVTWGRSIPHKTSIEGGVSKNGFPDAKYLKHLAAALKTDDVEES